MGAKVLDVGCGTGASALPAAEAVGETGFVVGVDLSSQLLERAHNKVRAAGLDNVEFRIADMTALGYPDASFDAVVSVFSIFFVPDMEGLVRELWRMVRPGGALAVTTWGPRIFEPAYSRWLSTLGKERPDLVTAFNPWDRITDVVSVRKLLQDGGVRDAEVIPEESVQPLRSADDWWTIALGSGLRWTIDQMGPEAATRVKQDNFGLQKTKLIALKRTRFTPLARNVPDATTHHVRFGSLADKPFWAKIQLCPLLSKSGSLVCETNTKRTSCDPHHKRNAGELLNLGQSSTLTSEARL